jgi:benzylsuccinate CoA-transferase BbsE subunit
MIERKLLSGCRVLDCSDEKGWFSAKLLAGMGAEVVRIDPPGHRLKALYAHGGKKSLSLNIEDPRGHFIFARLLDISDIFIECYTPGYLADLELDYSHLGLHHPALIMASITPYGSTKEGPTNKMSSLTASAAGGQLYLNGYPEGEPLPFPGPQAYLCASLFAANGILLALHRRRSSGCGQHIDISVQECVASALDHALVRYFSLGQVATRTGPLYWNKTFCLMPCRDGWVGLSFMQNWETVVGWMEADGQAADLLDPAWLNPVWRLANIDHIIAVIQKWTLNHYADELVSTAQLMHLPWARVFRPDELLNCPQLQERGFWIRSPEFEGKSYLFPGAPVKLSGSTWQVDSRFPQLGQDNRNIYHDWLGYSYEEIAQFETQGII